MLKRKFGRVALGGAVLMVMGGFGCDSEASPNGPSNSTTEDATGAAGDTVGGTAGATGMMDPATAGTTGMTDPATAGTTGMIDGTSGAGGEPSESCDSPTYAPGSCGCAEQNLPTPECDPAARTCFGDPVPPDQEVCDTCIEVAGGTVSEVNELTTCACNHCAVQLAGCFDSANQDDDDPDPIRDQQCEAVVNCIQETNCGDGVSCFCGDGVDETQCALLGAQGQCRNEIAAAAGCADEPNNIAMALCVRQATETNDPAMALTRAVLVGDCIMGEGGGQGACGHLM